MAAERTVEVAVFGSRQDRTYTYVLDATTEGAFNGPVRDRLLIVPFGPRLRLGYAVAEDVPRPRRVALKPIARVVTPAPFLDPVRLRLSHDLSRRFLWTFGETLDLFLPPDASLESSFLIRRLPPTEPMTPLESEISGALTTDAPVPIEAVQKSIHRKLNVPYLRQMARRKMIQLHEAATFSSDLAFRTVETPLTRGIEGFSLHHATRWTNEDWQRAADIVARGGQVLLIAPEKAFFEEISGSAKGRVHFFHSDLSPKNQTAVWNRISDGEPAIYAGTRSIVFAPFVHLAEVWALWEEDDRYVHQRHPRYDARWIAERLAFLWNAPFHGFTAAPSVPFYHRVKPTLDGGPPCSLTVLNLREKRISYMMTRTLHTRLEELIRAGGKAVFLMGRLGYSYLSCKTCGTLVTCPKCGHILIYSKRRNVLYCQPCLEEYPYAEACPECHSPTIQMRGAGTERLESELTRIFRGLTVFRLDSRSAPKPEQQQAILRQFDDAPGPAALVASPLILGERLSSPVVRVVIQGEQFWSFPDYTAAESGFARFRHFFEDGGEGCIQTFSPGFYLLKSLEGNDPAMFYAQELKMREQLGYPPYGHLLKIDLEGVDPRRVEREGRRLKQWMEKRSPENTIFLGPVVTEGGTAGEGQPQRPGMVHAQLLVKLPRPAVVDAWRADGWLDLLRASPCRAIAHLDTADPSWPDDTGAGGAP